MKDTFAFKASAIMTLENERGTTGTTKLVDTRIRLDVTPNLEEETYVKDKLPTQEGASVMTDVFVQALVTNIHVCHQNGWRDSAEHLRFIIAELEDGFVRASDVKVAKFIMPKTDNS